MTDTPNDAGKRIEQYIAVRDKIKELEDRHTEALKPLHEIKAMLSGWLQQFLDTTGSEAVKTEHGTAFLTTRYSATLADPKAFMDFVIANQKFDLLDKRANAPAVRDYVEANKTLPPGCTLTPVQTVGVRRK